MHPQKYRPNGEEAMNKPDSEGDPLAPTGDRQGTSTASSGPAGAHFEGQVAAFYLLAMLSGAQACGLPGATIKRVALQQANIGHPLDDVIVHATDGSGKPAVLAIQVKRTISFSPGDTVFQQVVGQIVETVGRPDFWSMQYEMAIATARSSRKIDGPYQDVLTRARQIGDATTFMAQIRLAGAANADMRAFVKTFQKHLKDKGSPHDEETIWKLLRRLQILTFNFTAPGSAIKELARERALHTLHADDASRVDALWGNLVELAISVATNGGDKTRTTLLESLRGFRFVGDRRHANARAALAEIACSALADIGNRVGKVVLARHERVAAVHEARGCGRYVEIRGDAGVGKSGVLRQVAESLQTEGQILVFSPGRCIPRGWSAMRAQIGFDGTLRELLVELASDGGAVVFLDNLDSFSDEERLTVKDILREAAKVPGVSILSTARTDFGVDERSWLPDEALELLGRTSPISIDELSNAEVEQLRTNDPALIPLLGDNHPARKITRNLFRLARLASQKATDSWPRTEVEMANQWWATADGQSDGWRDRARLLRNLAQQALVDSDILDVSAQPAQSIEALVDSGTLRKLPVDRVSFRHDVLREWAIACTLHEDASLIDELDLKRSATAVLARGMELAARMAIERAADGIAWRNLLNRLSGEGIHKSWRRAVLLALARSEAADAILPLVQPVLFADHALLLCELIRTVMVVDVVPASKAFAAAGVDPAFIPLIRSDMILPRGPAWIALILWLLNVGDGVPGEAIPEVVDLYKIFSFAVGSHGLTTITPPMTRQLYRWLRLMEPRSALPEPSEGPKFWKNLGNDQVQSLQSALRSSFFAFARTTPDLAAEYLQAVARSEHNDDLVRSILTMSGTLAQAAPAELARLTEQWLIQKPRPRHRRSGYERVEAFTFVDHEFLPASPAQGPFFELLVNSPKDGLALIHQLVGHAIAHDSQGRDAETNVITLVYPDSVRIFPWTETYRWSRGSYNTITSALMALEAWAHRRIAADEPFETVLKDVLGPPGSCAAYLLVAVDLIISHWPKSEASATEFLGCPELLSLDHTRHAYDRRPDLSGLPPEPQGAVSAAELKKRVSRRTTLSGLIRHYASTAPEQRNKLTSLLRDAADRLGPVGTQANFSDPEFMVRHALNFADPANWHEDDAEHEDGSTVSARQYISPASEQNHLQALKNAAADKRSDLEMQCAITLAIDDPSRFSSEQRLAAVAWASGPTPEVTSTTEDDGDDSLSRMRRVAVLAAAMITIRDGDENLRTQYGEWACAQLKDALKSNNDDIALQIRGGLRSSPIAIAYAGLCYALARQKTSDGVRALLEVAAVGRHAAAHGFGVAVDALHAVDERLPCSLLRCALRTCIAPVRKRSLSDEEKSARATRRKAAAMAAIDAEMAWLEGTGPEPQWPTFPKKRAQQVYHQMAALWLRQVQTLGDAAKCPWLRDVFITYISWTIEANGGELCDEEEANNPPAEWNDVFFALAARCVVRLTSTEVSNLVIEPIAALPDQNFFDVLACFLRRVDEVYFGGCDVQTSVAVEIRSALADRMLASREWEYLSGSRDLRIERHIGSAIATLFFNSHHSLQGTKCYLRQKGVERIAPFLPILDRLAQSGPSPFIALVLLNLLEVAPRAEHLGLIVQTGKTWLATYPDFRLFWIDHEIGKRWCEIAKRICIQDSAAARTDTATYSDIGNIVAELIHLGVPEAGQLEELLSSSQK